MTGTLTLLSLATLAFLGSHFLMSSQPVRDPLVKKLGQNGFLSFYTIVSIPLMVWLVLAYSNAPEIVYWEPPTYLRHGTLSFMIVACIFFAASTKLCNDSSVIVLSSSVSTAPGSMHVTRMF
ncbi:MAG: NnrU family protein, partial [Rhodospirillales bacterium]|nr:NnrU family protein [Rhodospirillales bacterium]